MNMPMLAWLRRAPPAYSGDTFWRDRLPEMRLEETMGSIEDEMGSLVRHELRHPRDLDQDRTSLIPVPRTADLFLDGIDIAHAILDWEERAGQPITPLLDHVKAAAALRKTVTEKANAPAEGAPT